MTCSRLSFFLKFKSHKILLWLFINLKIVSYEKVIFKYDVGFLALTTYSCRERPRKKLKRLWKQ